MVNIATFDRTYHGFGHAHDGVAGKTGGDLFNRCIGAKTWGGFGSSDDRRVVTSGDVGDTWPAHRSAGEDAVTVTILGFDNAVGSHHDGTGESRKLALLILPGAAIVTNQMRVLF